MEKKLIWLILIAKELRAPANIKWLTRRAQPTCRRRSRPKQWPTKRHQSSSSNRSSNESAPTVRTQNCVMGPMSRCCCTFFFRIKLSIEWDCLKKLFLFYPTEPITSHGPVRTQAIVLAIAVWHAARIRRCVRRRRQPLTSLSKLAAPKRSCAKAPNPVWPKAVFIRRFAVKWATSSVTEGTLWRDRGFILILGNHKQMDCIFLWPVLFEMKCAKQ